MRKYHHIIQELERMADIQLQIQNVVKLTNTANIELAGIKTTLLQASNTQKEQIREDIYCYELKSLELNKRTNSCIRVNTRELDRDPFTN